MIHEIFMPALSSTMTEGKITSWLKSPGDKIEKGETVLIVESDKADMDVESFNEGILAAIVVPAGDTAEVGSALGLLAETEAEVEEAKQKAAAMANGGSVAAPTAAPAAAAPSFDMTVTSTAQPIAVPSGRLVASPRAKKLAKDFGISLESLVGSGPHGRIVAEDVEAAAGKAKAPVAMSAAVAPIATAVAPVAKAAAKAPAPIATPPTPGQVVKMNTMQTAVVKNMMVSIDRKSVV